MGLRTVNPHLTHILAWPRGRHSVLSRFITHYIRTDSALCSHCLVRARERDTCTGAYAFLHHRVLQVSDAGVTAHDYGAEDDTVSPP